MSTRTTTIVTTGVRSVLSQPHEADHLLTDLFAAYYQARKNKRNTASQVRFEKDLAKNLISLYDDVKSQNYRPGRSMCFIISDPVKREIFASSFRDRIIHHYLYNKLEPVFEPVFICDSYSCRKGKGTLYGINRFVHHIRSCTNNFHREAYVLKLDIEGYFMNIDRKKLFEIVSSRIDTLLWKSMLPADFDYDTVMFLLRKVIFNNPAKGCRIKGSKADWIGLPQSKSLFHSPPGCGLPIGNLTSQLFSNIYLNELDQYVKRGLKFHHYGRYVDDMYLMDTSVGKLLSANESISTFLSENLSLRLNNTKTRISKSTDSSKFLGALISPSGVYISKSTRRRMERKVIDAICAEENPFLLRAKVNSYVGHLSHFKTTPVISVC